MAFGGGALKGGNTGDHFAGAVLKRKKRANASMVAFKNDIPLLKVLHELKPDQRTIVLASLDNKSCTAVVNCLRKLIKNKKLNRKTKTKLRKALGGQKETLRSLIYDNRTKQRKELLPRVGGGLGVALGAAIPILLEIARAKKWI